MAPRGALPAGVVALYAGFKWWTLKKMDEASAEGRKLGPDWASRACVSFTKLVANLNGVRVVSEGGAGLDNPPSSVPMICWHPHGFFSFTPVMFMGDHALNGKPFGTQWFGTCIPLLFKIPILGEGFQLTNARPVDAKTIDNILKKGGGVAIQPGGVKEQIATMHDQEQAFFPSKLGFIRMAIKRGQPLVPVYFFGENQLYNRVHGLGWLEELINKTTGMTVPMMTAKFGLPLAATFPIATDLHIRWGLPVDVGPADDNPSQERLNDVLEKYIVELQRIWDTHAADCLPAELVEKGLKIIRPQDAVPHSRL